MRITKISVGIFLVTFLIGWASAYVTKKIPAPVESKKITFETHKYLDFSAVNAPPKVEVSQETSNPERVPEFAPEIFDIPDYSETDEIPKFKIKLMDILETGNSFLDEEIEDAKSGETWLGLFKENGGFSLRNTKIKIRPDRRESYRGDEQTIKLSRKGEPVFLLKNAGKLSEGEVKTVYRSLTYEEAERLEDYRKPMKIGFVKKFKSGEKVYTFQVKAGLTKSGEKRSVLILKTGNKSQIVDYLPYFDGDYFGTLLWVGDLDRDGKLDFYMDFYNFEKGGFSSGLFLSSEAGKGKLVEMVAAFGTFGC